MRNTLFLFLVAVCSFIGNSASASDPDGIQEHPRLFFTPGNVAMLREKSQSDHFSVYTKDLLALADFHLATTPGDKQFPFGENPNFSVITLNLLVAYHLTENEDYVRRAIDLLITFCKTTDVGSVKNGMFKDYLEQQQGASFYLNTLAILYDSLYQEMTVDERSTVKEMLARLGHLTYTMAMTKQYNTDFFKNYTAGQMGALGLAGLALQGDGVFASRFWLDRALAVSLSWCNVAVKEDGTFPEGVNYLSYMLDNQLLFLDAMQRVTGVDYFARTHLNKSLDWFLSQTLGEAHEFDNFSDGSYRVLMFNQAAFFQSRIPGKGDFLAKHLNQGKPRYRSSPWVLFYGRDPDEIEFDTQTNLSPFNFFPRGKFVALRSGWDKDATLLFTSATDYEYAAHSQADRGAFSLYAHGQKWLVNPGYGNDGKTLRSSATSEAHNLVMIDQKGQGYAASMRQSGTYGDIRNYATSHSLAFTRIDQKQAYDFYVHFAFSNKVEFNPVEYAFRNLLFVDRDSASTSPPYVILFDDIKKDNSPHQYSQLFHASPESVVAKATGRSILLKPFTLQGKAIVCRGNGSWTDPVRPGFCIIHQHAGSFSLTFDVADAGDYALWSLCKREAATNGGAYIVINGKNHGRLQGGSTSKFTWNVFSENKDRMHRPSLIPLEAGKNTILFRGVFSGAHYAKFLLTQDKDFQPTSVNPVDQILLDHNQLSESDDDIALVGIHPYAANQCIITSLNDEVSIDQDIFQPSKAPHHARLSINRNAIKSNLLTLMIPLAAGEPFPKIRRDNDSDQLHAIIKWQDRTDNIYVALTDKPIRFASDQTANAQVLFTRHDPSGTLVRLLSSETKSLTLQGKTSTYPSPMTVIYDQGRINAFSAIR